MHQLFIDFKKAYDSVTREVLYNIVIEFGVPKTLIRLIEMRLTETYSRVQVCNNLSDMFPIRNGLKQGDALSPLLFNIALGYAIRRVQANQDGLKLNGSHHLLAYANDVNILGGSLHHHHHHLFFILWIRTGLQNPCGYGNSHVCLRGLVAKSV